MEEVKKGKEGKRKKMRRKESVLVHITVSERPGALPCEQSAEVQKVLLSFVIPPQMLPVIWLQQSRTNKLGRPQVHGPE